MIFVLGGEVELDLIDGNTIVTPRGYGLCFDPSGKELHRCSVFIGPIVTSNEKVESLPDWAEKWFGSDYQGRKARVDIPEKGWKSVGQAEDILYFRPGEHAADWLHKFSKPVPISKSGRWYRMKLPKDCRITWRGIERP